MSEINNSQGPAFNENTGVGNNEQQFDPMPDGISFQGEKIDLRYDPKAYVNKTFVEKTFKAKIDNIDVKFGSAEIKQVKADLEHFGKNPSAVQKATAIYPAFHGYARGKEFQNPDALALALENYAATVEFVPDSV